MNHFECFDSSMCPFDTLVAIKEYCKSRKGNKLRKKCDGCEFCVGDGVCRMDYPCDWELKEPDRS